MKPINEMNQIEIIEEILQLRTKYPILTLEDETIFDNSTIHLEHLRRLTLKYREQRDPSEEIDYEIDNPFTFNESFENIHFIFNEVEKHLSLDVDVDTDTSDDVTKLYPNQLPIEFFSRNVEIQNEFIEVFRKLVELEDDIKSIIYPKDLSQTEEVRKRVVQ